MNVNARNDESKGEGKKGKESWLPNGHDGGGQWMGLILLTRVRMRWPAHTNHSLEARRSYLTLFKCQFAAIGRQTEDDGDVKKLQQSQSKQLTDEQKSCPLTLAQHIRPNAVSVTVM